MGLQFSHDGPDFPTELIDELLEGRVTFLCGAGVSAPQLPGFAKLVDLAYRRLRAKKSDSERASIRAGRYEEALGSLARRMADPSEMYEAVSKLLKVDVPDLTNHTTLLRLSRDLHDRVTLVTTNFDTLFERAAASYRPATQSLAGQALPAPGDPGYAGIIHLHGRLDDAQQNLQATPLVLTSAEYGDAYMRAGWASRFLFDLARSSALVLVGYRAGDAPVRYFLNLLEGDRRRFDDLRPVYALDAVDYDSAQANERWESIAVRPIVYRRNANDTHNQHKALWRDLAQLADLVDRPTAWRRAHASSVLADFPEKEDARTFDTVEWLFRGKSDLLDVVASSATDPKWFDFLFDRELWTRSDASWVIATWCSQDWTDARRLETALAVSNRIGPEFGSNLHNRLLRGPRRAEGIYAKAWWLLGQHTSVSHDSDGGEAFKLAQRITEANCTDAELCAAVSLLSPIPSFAQPIIFDRAADGKPTMLSDVIRVRLVLRDTTHLPYIRDSLREATHLATEIMHVATEELRRAIALGHDAELISGDWDNLESAVPSVVSHAQNAHHEGVVELVTLLTDLLPIVTRRDPFRARTFALTWVRFESEIGARMYCHALTNTELFSSDEAAKSLLELPDGPFWALRPEVPSAIAARLATADAALISALIQRVVADSRKAFRRFKGVNNEWVRHARDHAIWVRLKALEWAGVLDPRGKRMLATIVRRDESLARNCVEQDLFASYSTGVRFLQGDPAQLSAAEPEERLQVAVSLTKQRDPEKQLGWGQFCTVSPVGALETLQRGPFDESTAGLWTTLLNRLTFQQEAKQDPEEITKLRERALSVLREVEPAFLGSILGAVVDLIPQMVAKDIPGGWRVWWDRLWLVSELRSEEIYEAGTERPVDVAINRPSGRLADYLMHVLKDEAHPLSGKDRSRLERVVKSETPAGRTARVVFMLRIEELIRFDRKLVANGLKLRVINDNDEARTLRQVLVEYSALGPSAERIFCKAVRIGAIEFLGSADRAVQVSARLLRPLCREFLWPRGKRPAIPAEAVREALAGASGPLLEGAAEFLRRSLTVDSMRAEDVWMKMVKPVLEAVWPAEERFRRDSVTRELAALCAGVGSKFPDAFMYLRTKMKAIEREHVGLYFLNSTMSHQFPAQTLDLLWTLFGPDCQARRPYDLGTTLDVIGEKAPDFQTDRRLQWLNQRAIRYA